MHRTQLLLLVFSATIALAEPATAPPAAAATEPAARYTFSWPLGGTGESMKPRGGSTRGAAIELDGESPAWAALQQPGLEDIERDRRAILAMAGSYRVTFDFLEIVPFAAKQQPARPYQSWGTEKIYVDSDTGTAISLLHILEMHMIADDGSTSPPIVVKHWRQDWRHAPAEIVEYIGNDRWQRRKLQAQPGQWLQTVYQVDESPRYAGIGRWEHTAAFSSWQSNDTWRPLPRREWSVRDDYQVLLGTNRHTVTAAGWVQEENNLKTVLTAGRQPDPKQPFLSREYGVARYDRIRGTDFAAADAYFESTRHFWQQVRDAWTTAFGKYSSITLRGPVDKLGLFEPLFARADTLAENQAGTAPQAREENAAVIRSALQNMGVPQ